MKTLEFMSWVDFLPEVGTPILAERDKLAAQLAAADDLERQAAALRASVQKARAPLVNKITFMWSLLDIEKAANTAAANVTFPPSVISDSPLRAAIAALDGAFSPLEILRSFDRGQVIRHTLSGKASAAEQEETLHRVFDWWNYAAAPLLQRLEH